MTHNQVVQLTSNWFKIKPEVELVSRFSYGFPVPDVQVQLKTKEIIQVECKPSGANKREYITGLGQAISYCTQADYSYLSLPKNEFLSVQKWLWPDYIGILIADNNKIEIKREAKKCESKDNSKRQEIKRGYAYYRDLKIQEIYFVMKSLENWKIQSSRTNKVDDVIWDEMQKHRKWKSSKNSNVLNIKLLLRDLKLYDFQNNIITENGFEVIKSGDLNMPSVLNELLLRLFLIEGNFIDIVAIIQDISEEYIDVNNLEVFKQVIAAEMIKEKLATDETNIERDLRDILYILKEFNILKESKNKNLFGTRYYINWKPILPLIKSR